MLLADGEPVERAKLPTITIAPGVAATLGWGRGALLERVEMQPGAVYPEQTLGEELIIIVQDGSATIEFDGKTAELTKDQVLYLQPGAMRSVKAGAERAGRRSRSIHRCGSTISRSPDRTRPA